MFYIRIKVLRIYVICVGEENGQPKWKSRESQKDNNNSPFWRVYLLIVVVACSHSSLPCHSTAMLHSMWVCYIYLFTLKFKLTLAVYCDSASTYSTQFNCSRIRTKNDTKKSREQTEKREKETFE